MSKLQKIVKNRKAWHAAVHRVTKSQTLLRDETIKFVKINQRRGEKMHGESVSQM